MKKIYRYAAAALAISAVCSCAKEIVPSVSDGLVPATLTIAFDGAATKTALTDDLEVVWELNDSIAVWDGIALQTFKVTEIKADGSAVVAGSLSEGATALHAFYPKEVAAFAAATTTTAPTAKLTAPSRQVVAAGKNVDRSALVSYGFASSKDATLFFKNLTSLAKVTLTKDATFVKINAYETKIAGKTEMEVSDNGALGELVCSGSTNVTLIPEGDVLKAGTYYIPVTPSKADSLSMVIGGKTENVVIESKNAAEFVRNSGLDFGDISKVAQVLSVPMQIKTVDDFKNFTQNAAYYDLADVVTFEADIDIKGEDWVCGTISQRFLGSIDGKNHRIYNYIVRSGEGAPNPYDAGVFGRVGSGSASAPYFVKNLVFGSKDYDFATGKGTYDGVSKITFEAPNNGADGYFYPGAIAYCYAYGTMENLVNFTPVEVTDKCTSPHRAGALLGTVKANVTIRNCTNYGDVSDATVTCTKNPTVGGISGCFDGANCLAENCVNYGNITVTAPKILDFAGVIAYNNFIGTIKNCQNHGKITGKYELSGSTNVGGIVSRYTKGGSVMENCFNDGEIVVETSAAQDVFVGGIIGRVYGTEMTNCDNAGKITVVANNTGKKAYVGGVAANSVNQNSVLSSFVGCDNSADVILQGGGTAGYVCGVNAYNANNTPGLKMDNCINTGAITYEYISTGANGGVAGVNMFSNGITNMTGCVNKGTITYASDVKANSFAGGISGIWGTVATHVIDACSNEGAIVVDNSKMTDETKIIGVGGIAGTTYGSVKNSVNKGTITTGTAAKSARLCVGGITGGNYYLVPAVENCTNEGAITVGTVSTKASNCIGGIVGPLSCKVLTGCASKGNITVTGSAANLVFVGGIAGGALAKETGIAGELPATVGLDGCSVDCAIVNDSASAGFTGSVLGNVTVATEIALGATTPIAVKGSVNGTALTAGALQTLGSSVNATNVTVNAVLAE